MLKVAEEQDLAAVVETAVKKHGAHAMSSSQSCWKSTTNMAIFPARPFEWPANFLHQPEDHILVSEGRLYGLASFYHMLSTEKTGRHVVQFCESAPCHVQGGRELWNSIQKTLNLKAGETDPEGRFTLKTVSCLGACGVGPVILVDDDMYGNVTPKQLADIFAKYE